MELFVFYMGGLLMYITARIDNFQKEFGNEPPNTTQKLYCVTSFNSVPGYHRTVVVCIKLHDYLSQFLNPGYNKRNILFWHIIRFFTT